MTFSGDDRLTCPPEVLSRVLDGEAILLHLGSGTYFGTNEVASVVWEKIVRGVTFGEVVHLVVESFEVTEADAARDLAIFVAALVDKGLCTVSPPQPA